MQIRIYLCQSCQSSVSPVSLLCQSHVSPVSVPCQSRVSPMSVPCQSCVSPMSVPVSVLCQSCFSHVSVMCHSCVSHVSVMCQSCVSHVSVLSQPCVSHVSVMSVMSVIAHQEMRTSFPWYEESIGLNSSSLYSSILIRMDPYTQDFIFCEWLRIQLQLEGNPNNPGSFFKFQL